MKKIIFVLIFTQLCFSQTNKGFKYNVYYGNNSGFNPLNDANTIALYDGDLDLSPASWVDQKNAYDITMVGTPTIVDNAVNGHDAVRFDGVSQCGNNSHIGLLIAQPYTIYLVLKQITLTDNDRIIGMKGNNLALLRQESTGSTLLLYAGGSGIQNNQLAVGNYGIITTVWNGATSTFRINNNTAITGSIGSEVGSGGFYLCAGYTGLAQFANCEVAYMVVRSGADDTPTQDNFIEYLKNRFGL